MKRAPTLLQKPRQWPDASLSASDLIFMEQNNVHFLPVAATYTTNCLCNKFKDSDYIALGTESG